MRRSNARLARVSRHARAEPARVPHRFHYWRPLAERYCFEGLTCGLASDHVGKRVAADNSSMAEPLLPLFPLSLVLLPSTPLPLHIFEERYKEMIGLVIA